MREEMWLDNIPATLSICVDETALTPQAIETQLASQYHF